MRASGGAGAHAQQLRFKFTVRNAYWPVLAVPRRADFQKPAERCRLKFVDSLEFESCCPNEPSRSPHPSEPPHGTSRTRGSSKLRPLAAAGKSAGVHKLYESTDHVLTTRSTIISVQHQRRRSVGAQSTPVHKTQREQSAASSSTAVQIDETRDKE